MTTLRLHHENPIQGSFQPRQLNLLLVFQVNCPGCFLHALPLFTELYKNEQLNDLGFLTLSTAFEDFDKNTLANTELLLEKGRADGERRKKPSLNTDMLPCLMRLNFLSQWTS